MFQCHFNELFGYFDDYWKNKIQNDVNCKLFWSANHEIVKFSYCLMPTDAFCLFHRCSDDYHPDLRHIRGPGVQRPRYQGIEGNISTE